MLKFLKNTIGKIFGTKFDKDFALYSPRVSVINDFYQQYQSLTNDQLRQKSLEFRSRIQSHLAGIDEDIVNLEAQSKSEADFSRKEDLYAEIDQIKKDRDKHLEDILNELLPEAFAVVKETCRRFMNNETLSVTATTHDRELAARNKSYININGDKAVYKNSWKAAGGDITWNMLHYDVQLIGGMVLHDGKIAEMGTGEGKTLVATLPAYLNGLSGEGVHVITVNNYLALRDSEWVGPIFEFLFLTVDCIDKYKPHTGERYQAYRCDITYGTNNEFGFDYLRDNMVRSAEERVQRKHHYAMIDEVDSVLIDEARTPLIISGPVPKGSEEQEYEALKPRVERLINEQRKLATQYLAEAKSLFKDGITGYEEGEAGLALLRAHRALPKNRATIKFLSEEGVKVMFQKAENNYMQEQSKHMHLVDEPLLFTIEEKTRTVDLTERGAEFLARGGEDPSFFILPDIALQMMLITKNEEMSQTEKEEAKENLTRDFSIKSKRLHSIHQLLKAYTLFEKDEEYVVMEGQVKIVDEQTGRMMEGRRYSDGLHQALEAKENVEIGDLTQTYATITLQNYFRMFHKLAGMTGTAETEASEFWEIYKLDVVVIPTNKPIAREDREDLVYKTAKEKFSAVINDIVNLSTAGRPVLVGTTSVDISEKLSRMLQMRGIEHNVLNAKQHQREAEIVAEAGKPGKVTIATNMAGRGTDIKINDAVKAAGGLAIIGTERHDSRRVDRQLRGRSGRQGDPGSSQFYVSLEDNLMRLFQSERIAKVMDKMGLEEGEVIQHSMVSKSIERAQKKVEENNYGVRKRLLEYDDVMNIQREAIYKKRDNALEGKRLAVDLHATFMNLVETLVLNHRSKGDFDSFHMEVMSILGFAPEMDRDFFTTKSVDEVVESFQDQFLAFYNRKKERIAGALLPTVKRVFENQGHRYKRIMVPFTDGSSRALSISAHLEDGVKSNGESIMLDIEKAVALAIVDEEWKEHLRSMDELKESAQAASFEQKDPLVIYKMEAYNLFEQLVHSINEQVTSYLSKGKIVIDDGRELEEAREQKTDLSKTKTSRSGGDADEAAARARAAAEGVSQQKQETIRRSDPKVGRNDICPCGSGKKYKHCHGRS
jgi:preprotein translocase subunit SecA